MDADEHRSGAKSRVDIGRQSQYEGKSFEERVAEAYRLLRYNVEHGRLFSGRQVDLFLIGRFGDLIVQRAIECKAGPVKAEHLDAFIAKLRLVRKEYPAAQGTIVSGVSFTDAITSQAAQEGIQLTLYRDLAAQIFDGYGYARKLISECEASERYRLAMYVEHFMAFEFLGKKVKAFDVIDQWLGDRDWSQLTVLGDVGTGKSFLSRMVAYRLSSRFLENPIENPVPVLIDLRNADRQFSLEGIVLTHMAQMGLSYVSFDAFQYALAQGHIVLILDGFDEMAARVTKQVTSRNFYELARSVQGKAKVLLTCRTHYFRSRTEEEEVVLGGMQDYGSETVRDLYWELIARKGFQITYLSPFEMSQIEEYVTRARPDTYKDDLQKIRGTYNLIELSQRPMLLEMIVKSIDTITARQINAATLYQVFTDAWIHRDSWRDVLSAEAKLQFVTALARSLWEEDLVAIHYSRLLEYLREELSSQIHDAQQLVEIDSEVRTASFLTRDDAGFYGLAHKSYGEFFLARHLAGQMMKGELGPLDTRRLSPEVISFLSDLVEVSAVEPLLEGVLVEGYVPQVSENALLCLYGLRRGIEIARRGSLGVELGDDLVVEMPSEAKLGGARLEQATLEGAVLKGVDFSGANLSEAILSGADLSNGNLGAANLGKGNLAFARLVAVSMDSTILDGANLEGADLRDSSLIGASLRDAFLGSVLHDGVNLRGAVLGGAVLPESLKSMLERPELAGMVSESVRTVDPVMQEYWSAILQLRPHMLSAARLVSLRTGADAEDIVSASMIRLSSKRYVDLVLRMSADERRQFVRTVIQRSARLPAYLSVPDGEEVGGVDAGVHSEEVGAEEGEGEDENMAKVPAEKADELVAAELDEAIVEMMQGVYGEEKEHIDLTTAAVDPSILDLLSLPLESNEPYAILMSDVHSILSGPVARLIELHFVEGYDLEEIAARERMSIKEVRQMVGKGVEIIRKYLADAELGRHL